MPVRSYLLLSVLGLMSALALRADPPLPRPIPPPPEEAPRDAGGKPALQPLELHRLRAHGGKMVIGATFSPDGKWLASAGWDNKVRLWDPQTMKETLWLDGHTTATFISAFSPDGKTLATGGNGHVIFLWDLATGKQRKTLKGHTAGTTHLAFSPDGKSLASGSYDQTCRVWDVATGKSRIVGPRTGAGTAYAVAISPDGQLLAIGRAEGSITLYRLRDGEEVRKMEKSWGNVWNLQFSPDGRLLASGEQSGSPGALWEVATGKLRLALPSKSQLTTTFSPDGALLATGGANGNVELWDAGTGELIALVGKHDSKMVPSVVFSPDGSRLASASHDGTLRLWKVPPRKPPAEVAEPRPEELRAFWDDLAGSNGVKAHRAIHAFHRFPEPTLRLMRENLRPAPPGPKVDPARVAGWIEQLDADEFRTREDAHRELARLGKRIRAALEAALAKTASLEARRRLKELLATIRPGILSGPEIQRLRAVEVLEHLGSAGAREFLARLAEGSEGALLTREAQQALARLARQGDSPPARKR
jgi:Tol biopolymer transport system component